jgi:hypothetical protein
MHRAQLEYLSLQHQTAGDGEWWPEYPQSLSFAAHVGMEGKGRDACQYFEIEINCTSICTN